ncbi:uncharacterized protein LOC126410644 [Nymphaea colorata]|uniref:uncharacterized protein LOC126410644 n=1 Tax=Nymphaea colorata TaxID=210225 RepID=UPI00214DF8B0|nr:uncharacterized protein LOC126410644 [Nymphaea colorata]
MMASSVPPAYALPMSTTVLIIINYIIHLHLSMKLNARRLQFASQFAMYRSRTEGKYDRSEFPAVHIHRLLLIRAKRKLWNLCHPNSSHMGIPYLYGDTISPLYGCPLGWYLFGIHQSNYASDMDGWTLSSSCSKSEWVLTFGG